MKYADELARSITTTALVLDISAGFGNPRRPYRTISSSVSAHPAQLVPELTPREWKRRWRDSAAKAAAYGVRPRRLSGLSSVGAITGNDRCVRQLRLM